MTTTFLWTRVRLTSLDSILQNSWIKIALKEMVSSGMNKEMERWIQPTLVEKESKSSINEESTEIGVAHYNEIHLTIF